jgi:hypothetical protein
MSSTASDRTHEKSNLHRKGHSADRPTINNLIVSSSTKNDFRRQIRRSAAHRFEERLTIDVLSQPEIGDFDYRITFRRIGKVEKNVFGLEISMSDAF